MTPRLCLFVVVAGDQPGCIANCPGSQSPSYLEVTLFGKKLWTIVCILTAFALLVSCGPAPRVIEEQVLVGVIYPLTGGLAASGEDVKAGVEFAVELVNGEFPDLNLPLAADAGLPNLAGAKVVLIFGDHEGDAEKAMSEAERLVTEEGVVALVGCYNSSATATASQAAERLQVPFLAPESSSPMLTERGFEWFFRTTPHDELFTQNFFEFLDSVKEKGIEVNRVAILNEKSLWGTGIASLERRYAKQFGYEVVAETPYSNDTTDMSSEVQTLKAAAPDVVLQSSYISDAILSMKTYKDLDFNPPAILAMDAGFVVPEFLETLGDDADYVFSRDVLAPDLASTKPLIGTLHDMFKERTGGRSFGGNSARAFTGMLTLLEAINRAGSVEPMDIREALLETDIPADQLIMPWKGVRFDPVTHQNTLGAGIIIQYQDGEKRTVWPFDLASAELIWPMPAWDER
jgi:branched-chain amino acid transport system substrate-binding protein